jgi:methionyl-tRNA formyltransferase
MPCDHSLLTSAELKQDLYRRMEVFGANHFGISPKINLHGIEFQAIEPTPRQT